VLRAAPRIKLEKEPQGRIRWLESDEEARLLHACRASKHPDILGVMTVALETGIAPRRDHGADVGPGGPQPRRDPAGGHEVGKRREVPMRQIVYEILAARPEPREGCVFSGRSIRVAFERAVEAAKLDNFHFHILVTTSRPGS